ncbi:helix-turn-helix domain-containing protein [Prolixibacteraceae bacterium Z1-6]|uniref:Helix-turn-helix domain-containing protein n=1 Tax=Draconibacterium aestuarii TaxID=2998507 RepID=A0A9X3J6Z1_9BACT|nr:helix-turn-helix domain-containing protein [Prolixibacteraceae bacterium Z1-6]
MISSFVNNFVTVVMFGALLLLAFVKLANPLRINRKGNFFFGLLLVMWASFWLEEISALSGINMEEGSFSFILRGLQIFTPLLLFLSIKFYSNPNYKFQQKDVKHLLIPIVFITLITVRWFSEAQNTVWGSVTTIIMLFQALFYVILSFLKIRQHRKKLVRFASSIRGKDLNWLEYILILLLSISLIAMVFSILQQENPGLIMNSANLVVVIMVAYYSIRQKEIYNIQEPQKTQLNFLEEEEDDKSSKRKLLEDNELEELKEQLTSLMTKEAPYLDSELNLVKLSEQMDLTPHQLSYTINTGFDQNFFQFVNQYRVEKAKELLLDKSHNYTILAIAFESGFNSKTSFNTTFKKMTGQTPTEFKKRQTLQRI